MTYAEQTEQYIAAYPTTSSVHVPEALVGLILPTYPDVVLHGWTEDYCELQDADWTPLARFKLVG